MQYQVVARTCLPSVGKWDYYPYLAPNRDKPAAERLARYAAQNGYESAILQSVTLEMLAVITHTLVEQQDERLLPALRYLPAARTARAGMRAAYDQDPQMPWSDWSALNPYGEGPDKIEWDERRCAIEMGPGGDVTMDTTWRGESLTFPVRMDVVSALLRLRERLLLGYLGGGSDGSGVAHRTS